MNEIVFSGHQPNFLPYMGLFYKIAKSDYFVIDNDVQYTTSGCMHKLGAQVKHNSNLILAKDGVRKIFVPVHHSFNMAINKVKIAKEDKHWEDNLLKTVRYAYGKHPYFWLGYGLLSNALDQDYQYLWQLNTKLIKDIAKGFGFRAKILIASDVFDSKFLGNERNIDQCKRLGANVYYSGIGGKVYNDEAAYKKNGIKLLYSDYEPVIYTQWHNKNFVENLSVLDYIMNCGFDRPMEWPIGGRI